MQHVHVPHYAGPEDEEGIIIGQFKQWLGDNFHTCIHSDTPVMIMDEIRSKLEERYWEFRDDWPLGVEAYVFKMIMTCKDIASERATLVAVRDGDGAVIEFGVRYPNNQEGPTFPNIG